MRENKSKASNANGACDYIELATTGVKGLHPYQPGKPVEELERELGITNIVKLASNENPLGPSALAAAAVQKVFVDGARYPDGNGFVLKQALSDYLKVEMNTLTLGNGSNDVLDLITRAYAGPGDDVIYSQYAFAVYALSTQAVGANAVVTPAKDWGHDLDAMRAAVTEQTRLIFIANPNNPTGTWLSAGVIRRFLERIPERVVVVLDEAYCEYIDNADYPDGVSLLGDFSNLVVTRTFSKAWGLASLRVGYAVSNPVIADILNRVRHPFNVNSPALAAAAAVLFDGDYLAKGKKLNQEGLAQVEAGLIALGLSYIPSVGNFICFDTGRDGSEVYQALLHQGVIVRPLGAYGMPSHLRVSIGTADENQRFLNALAHVNATQPSAK